MKSIKHYSKVIGLDALAILCFIGVILFGWLPGPGGIPLFLAGLALLAINHPWAKRALVVAKSRAKNLKKFFFPNWPWAHLAYDIAAFIVFTGAVYVFIAGSNKIVDALSVAAVCMACAIFLVNRDRLDRFSTKIRNSKHKYL